MSILKPIIKSDSSGGGGGGGAFKTGTVITDGTYGVTISHNKGDLNYMPKASVIGANSQALRAGQLSFVKAANTCVVYNTGDPVTIMYELSGVAS